jgi:hypothetical protein
VLVAIHSTVVGLFLLLATSWGASFGGWGPVFPLFFARQAGVFHFVVAAGYVIEYFRYGGVSLLLTAKATAVTFLLAMTLVDGGPWALPASAAADAMMGAVVYAVARRDALAARERQEAATR